jgi:hypothetical protein
LGSKEFALEDDVDEAVVLRFVNVEKRLGRKDTGVIEQHVETAEPFHCRLHKGFASSRQSDVPDVHEGTLAFWIDLARGSLGFGPVATVDHNGAAFRNEPGRNLFAHSRGSAGDDRDLVLETHANLLSIYR